MSDTYQKQQSGRKTFPPVQQRRTASWRSRMRGTGEPDPEEEVPEEDGARGRRRGQGPDMAKIVLIAIGVVIFLICAAVGLSELREVRGDRTQRIRNVHGGDNDRA